MKLRYRALALAVVAATALSATPAAEARIIGTWNDETSICTLSSDNDTIHVLAAYIKKLREINNNRRYEALTKYPELKLDVLNYDIAAMKGSTEPEDVASQEELKTKIRNELYRIGATQDEINNYLTHGKSFTDTALGAIDAAVIPSFMRNSTDLHTMRRYQSEFALSNYELEHAIKHPFMTYLGSKSRLTLLAYSGADNQLVVEAADLMAEYSNRAYVRVIDDCLEQIEAANTAPTLLPLPTPPSVDPSTNPAPADPAPKPQTPPKKHEDTKTPTPKKDDGSSTGGIIAIIVGVLGVLGALIAAVASGNIPGIPPLGAPAR